MARRIMVCHGRRPSPARFRGHWGPRAPRWNYPDTLSDVPAITAEEWWSGVNADPVMVPMTDRGIQVKKVLDHF
jgi:hypothetical protein